MPDISLWQNLRPLFALSDNKRPLAFLIMAALAVGMPVLLGALLGHYSIAILAAMGGLSILYMPQTAVPHRLITMAVVSFGFSASFTLGALTSYNPALSASTLGLTAILATTICRYFKVPPPGSFFFILVACMARTLPFDLALVAERSGLVLFGTMGACLLALVYGAGQTLLKDKAPRHRPPATPDQNILGIVLEASTIGLFIGGGYFLALTLGLDNPYWVPVSCAAVMQGATFRAIWHRNIHRIVGTLPGMGMAWLILALDLAPWQLALVITGLSFVIETLVTRNYGLAVIFITPLTVLFADANSTLEPEHLVTARLADIVLGSMLGYLGGWVIHHRQLFQALENRIRR
ncbi:FUSC family protein [Gilvimarinus sp. F26214L]|uniref:FUSC family protein n=1 Tax=Gilvimarinus sp. DZF01 TaxID=3461371 RepID=UPI0040462AC0